MLKQLFKNIFVTLISVTVSLFVYTVISDFSNTSGYSIPYVVAIGIFNCFVPFLVFFSIVAFTIRKLSRRNKRYNSLLWQMLIAFAFMLIVILPMTAFDLYNSSSRGKEQGMNYLRDYGLFIAFVPLAVVINYLLYVRKKEISG